jgi:hypothetical protein
MEIYKCILPAKAGLEVALKVVITEKITFSFQVKNKSQLSKIDFEEDTELFEKLLAGLELQDFTYAEAISVIAGYAYSVITKSVGNPTQAFFSSYLENLNISFLENKKHDLEMYTDGFEDFQNRFRQKNKPQDIAKTNLKVLFIDEEFSIIVNGHSIKFGKKTYKRLKLICAEIERRMDEPDLNLPLEIDGEECIKLFSTDVEFTSVDERNLSHIFKRDKEKISVFALLDNNQFCLK